MANQTDFTDQTPTPQPAPKKWHSADLEIPWAVGQTFQQAVAAQVPLGIRSKTLAFAATIKMHIDVTQD